ncbi:MAG: TorF family putative porin [Candidatus Thiodiazotropha sp. (ex Lucinoma borealis)]|nr:TorF family putative porin [Candidatus Thiodiazotropha sp. (ex Lucinoma borealis)]MCU7839914.1 TorF family putative porin [Candidatus Thiodiazotropha sp. (ex Troendleina suluensis)]MCU7866553.1 TorF family putative porin [Candidatus Thiodiazotropha sp. (ex Lucinoma borealis)]MCU7867451.1 TorF family putative porin [Candidatus Thiodiazotropha sp. (ex Lucinoma borealis)]MCU7946011.1 TorF family putative porin [Candidatus Thiodiazotropha sp. (ex Cardiolucina cf. quadrata)]
MKMNPTALACGVAMLGLSSVAAAEVSTNIGVTSNYIWRGLTQSGNSTSFSGGFDWSGESGLYAGTWLAEAWDDFELDLYGGYAGEVGGFGYDAGLIYYVYSSDADSNFAELYVNGSWQFLTAGLAYTLSAEDAVEAIEEDLYYYLGASFDLPQDFSIGLTVGFAEPDGDGEDDAEDYTHYQLDLTKATGDFGDVTLSLSDTDLDGTDAAGEDADMHFFISWNKSF